tara:strand:- start:117 stop:1331 length:1215 start_codon:yes stop_codon:yes gene_type:complete
MAIFDYTAINKEGTKEKGVIDAINVDVAISSLQKRGLTIASIEPQKEKGAGLFTEITFFSRVSNKDVVILSRQIATMFEAQVSALRVFKLISAETENPKLHAILEEVAADIQGGETISSALSKHSRVFSDFYVSMVRAGEESGRLDQTFSYLADYLDRTYEVTSKAKGALVYPAFVIATFIAVMILMLTVVIPRITTIITESGQEIPIYTKMVIGLSDFFVKYGIFLGIAIVIIGFILYRYVDKTEDGKVAFSQFRLGVPYLGDLYRKFFLARIADNMHTMVISGIPMIQALEVTADVVGDKIYREILLEVLDAVRGGSTMSKAFEGYDEIPGIFVQMVRVGEETGALGDILKTMAKFYRREVENAVDTLVSLIEPAMIVLLGAGVGILLAAVLLPIYNISAAF